MAGRNFTPVSFTLEKNVVFLFGRVFFGANGAVSLDTNNSKGTCAAWQSTPTFTGTTSSGSAVVSSITSFFGLYTGMSLTGNGVSGTIGTISASTKSIVMSALATSAQATTTISASGGQYVLQFGTIAGVALDTYAKFLRFTVSFDETTGSATGTATQAAFAPTSGGGFVIRNNTSVRTVPGTATSGSTDCTLVIQFGLGNGTGFVATNPAAGEAARYAVVLGNSNAP